MKNIIKTKIFKILKNKILTLIIFPLSKTIFSTSVLQRNEN